MHFYYVVRYIVFLIVTSVYQYTEGIGLLIDQCSALFKLFTNQGKRKIGKEKARNSWAIIGIARVKE